MLWFLLLQQQRKLFFCAFDPLARVGNADSQHRRDFFVCLILRIAQQKRIAIVRRKQPDRPPKIHPFRRRRRRARNRGIDIARGDYLGFVDSDDYVLPEMFETLCRTADAEGADIVDCEIEAFYSDGRTERLRTWRDGKPIAAAGSACNKLFRRAFVGGTRFPEGLKYEDFGFSAKLLLRSEKTVHLPDALYRYRVGQPSTMHNANSRMNLDLLEVMEELREGMDPVKDRDDFEFLVLNHVLLDAIKRVAAQRGPERDACLRALRGYVQREIPRLESCAAYRSESRGRRTVMRLNYLGMHDLALKLLDLKKG